MKRILFTLSMPGCASWNGRWSGEDRYYAIIRSITNAKAERLFPNLTAHSWYYSFGDGWAASVTGRPMAVGERARKSAGFCGYDWMVDSILANERIVARRTA